MSRVLVLAAILMGAPGGAGNSSGGSPRLVLGGEGPASRDGVYFHVEISAASAPDLSSAKWEALDGYAQDIGLAFQIQDDILDVEGNIEDLGKAIGADAARDKPTYPSVLGLEAAKTRARDLQHRACERLAPFGARAAILTWLASFVVARRA